MLRIKFQSPITEAQILSIRSQMQNECDALALDGGLKAMLVSLADELSCNIMEHSEASWIELSLEITDAPQRASVFTVRDDGVAFDPIEAAGYFEGPVIVPGLDRHLGLWMMSTLIPELEYQRIDERINQLVFTRKLA